MSIPASWKRFTERGDTIVEVIIAIAIISLVLVSAFGITNSSVRAIRVAQEHSEAQSLLESKVETLRAADPSLITGITKQATQTPFCIYNDAGVIKTVALNGSDKNTLQSTADDNFATNYPAQCIDSNRYNSSVTYNSTTKIFSFSSRWDKIGGDRDQVTYLYRWNEGSVVPAANNPLPVCSNKDNGPNLLLNPYFATVQPYNTSAHDYTTNTALVHFDSQLPYRGTDLFPDDQGNVSPEGEASGQAHGGYGIITQAGTNVANSDLYGHEAIPNKPFQGDPANGIPAMPRYNYIYSNPLGSESDPFDPYGSGPFTGVIWGTTVTGLDTTKAYDFSVYVRNMIPTEYENNTGSTYVQPSIVLRMNGATAKLYSAQQIPSVSLSAPADKQWTRVQYTFQSPASGSALLQIYDNANGVNGDDFGMTAVGLRLYQQCNASISAAPTVAIVLPPSRRLS